MSDQEDQVPEEVQDTSASDQPEGSEPEKPAEAEPEQPAEPEQKPEPEPEPENPPEPEPEKPAEPEPEPENPPEPEPEKPAEPEPEPEKPAEPEPEPEKPAEPEPEPEKPAEPEPEPELEKPAAAEPEPEKPKEEGIKEVEEPLAAATSEQKEETEDEVKEKEHVRKVFRSTQPNKGVDIAMGDKGIASVAPITVGKILKESCRLYGARPGLAYKEDDQWVMVPFTEYYKNCVNAAKSFIKLGLERYNAVGIMGFNSPEWLYSNLGAMFAGGLSAGIYTTNGPEACYFVAQDCKVNIMVVEDQKQLDKILEIRDRLPALKAIVQYKGKLSQAYENVYDWEQFIELGKDIEDSVVEEKINNQQPEECALLIYTSGTTGNPKGVMLSHDNLTWTARALFEVESDVANWRLGEPASVISYLPLSHIAGQMADIYLPMYVGATVYFANPDALKGSLLKTIVEVKPTMFFGVPRVWEKVMEGMQSASANVTGIKKKLGQWATAKGFEGNVNIQKKRALPWGWTIANSFVLSKIRERLGLNETKILHVGAAPVHRDVIEYFMKFNLPVLELYGMSENTGPSTLNTIKDWNLGSVGKKMMGTEIKIDKANENGDGEICMYGRHVFMGYLNNEEKTLETIDDDGWLHSGDIGKLDKDGFLFITGRIKELIITSGGENIAPVPIEDNIKAELPFVSNVMLIGDKRKFLSCLVTLKCVMDPDTAEPRDELAPQIAQRIADLGCDLTKPSEIAKQKVEAVMKKIQEGLDKANDKAASRAQKVQKFTLLGTDFSLPGGELGPTLKLKRRIVVQKYETDIDGMYEEVPKL